MFLIGLFIIAFALPLAITTLRNLYMVISHPLTYSFAAGMTATDVTMLAALYLALVGVGIVLMVFGWMRRKNKVALDSIKNCTKQNYCNHCNINVSDQSTICPVCGKILKDKGE